MEEKTVFIYNTAEQNVLGFIEELFEKSIRINCAIAFLSLEGWYSLKPIILKWIEKPNTELIRIIVRRDDKFPDKIAIQEMSMLKKVSIGIYHSTEFHIKQWIFYTPEKVFVLTGSSNFTKKGLTENIEANIITELEFNSNHLQEINNIFTLYWNKSIKISEEGNMAITNLTFKIANVTLSGISWIAEHYQKNPNIYDYRMNGVTLSKGYKAENIFCPEITVTFNRLDDSALAVLNEFKETFNIKSST